MATLAHIDTGYLFARQHTERSLKINAYMHKPDVQKHKLRTPNTQTQKRVHIHTNTKHTSRLSLCFQLPDRPRGNQNFDTPGWKRRAGEPGGARGARVHTDTQAHTQTHSSAEHRLSLGFQAGDRPRCTENVKTWHWGEGKKKLCSSDRSHVFILKKNLRWPQGRWLSAGGVGELQWPDYLLLFHGTIHCCSWRYFPVVCFGLCYTHLSQNRVVLKWYSTSTQVSLFRAAVSDEFTFVIGGNKP